MESENLEVRQLGENVWRKGNFKLVVVETELFEIPQIGENFWWKVVSKLVVVEIEALELRQRATESATDEESAEAELTSSFLVE